MASLRRIPKSPYWVACITLPNGKRTNRSTKTTDRRLAQKVADDWQTIAGSTCEARAVQAQARRVIDELLVLT